jgi:hypothetical protein
MATMLDWFNAAKRKTSASAPDSSNASRVEHSGEAGFAPMLEPSELVREVGAALKAANGVIGAFRGHDAGKR